MNDLQDHELDQLIQLGYHGAYVVHKTPNNELLIQADGQSGVVRGWLLDFMTVEDIEWVRPNGIYWPKEVRPGRKKA